MDFEIDSKLRAAMYSRSGKGCGFAHEDDFMFVRIDVKKEVVLAPGSDDNGKTCAILCRLVTWEIEIHPEFCSPIEIETQLRHQSTLLAKMEVPGATSKLAVTPAMKNAGERLDEETTLFRRANNESASHVHQSRERATNDKEVSAIHVEAK